MYTIFGSENRESVFLFSDLQTLEVYTIFESEDLGGLMFDAILSGGPRGEAPQESRGVCEAARPPNEGDGRGGMVQSMDFGDGTILGDGQGCVDLKALPNSSFPFRRSSRFKLAVVMVVEWSTWGCIVRDTGFCQANTRCWVLLAALCGLHLLQRNIKSDVIRCKRTAYMVEHEHQSDLHLRHSSHSSI